MKALLHCRKGWFASILIGIVVVIVPVTPVSACGSYDADDGCTQARCGSASGRVFGSMPADGELCSLGVAYQQKDAGDRYSWICKGRTGTASVSCSAAKKIDPVCGSSNGQTVTSSVSSGFCSVGVPGMVRLDGMTYSWSCSTSSSVKVVSCSAHKKPEPKPEPACGSANGSEVDGEPKNDLCSVGDAKDMRLDGQTWSWTCKADSCSKPVTCSAHQKQEPTPEPEPEPEPEDKDDSCDDDSSIGNLVWNDRNKNGIQDDGEEGLAGITVKLIDGNDVEKDTTNSEGHYKFDDLCKGDYTVVVDAEDLGKGCYPTYDKDGVLDHMTKVALGKNQHYSKADFGYHCPSDTSAPRTGAGAVVLSLAGGLAGAATYVSRKFFLKRS